MGRLGRIVDWLTTLPLLALAVFSVFILVTIDKSLAWQQVMAFGVGATLLLFFASWESVWYWWGMPIWYLATILALGITYLGPSVRGATRWIQIGGAQLQTSEFMKPFLLLAWARLMCMFPPRYLRNFPLHIFGLSVPFILVFKQPDLGSSLVYLFMWLGMMLAGGFPVKYLLTGVVVLLVFAPLGWNILAPYQKARIEIFINPEADRAGAGYNALQSTIAVGSGGVWGRGLGRGTQSHLRFLPEYHTDFIFATIIEELGLLGGLLLYTIYATLLYRILLPLVNNPHVSSFVFLYSIGVFTMILVQLFINSGMNMGLIPVTGITLPFISYGGSSIVGISIMLGILISLKRSYLR